MNQQDGEHGQQIEKKLNIARKKGLNVKDKKVISFGFSLEKLRSHIELFDDLNGNDKNSSS